MNSEEYPDKKRSKTSWFARRDNAPVYDVTVKIARNWCKKCFVTRVLSDIYETT